MATTNIIAEIRSQVADEMQIEMRSNNRIVIYTPFMYDDGDQCSFQLVRDSAKASWYLTDEGEILNRASYSGIDLLAEDRKSRFCKTAEFYGIKEVQRELFYPVEGNFFGNAFFAFSQACLDILQLIRLKPETKERTKRDFNEILRKVVTAVISDERIEERWYDKESDVNRVYPVDMRINGRIKPLYIYGVTNATHCLMATVSCLHHANAGRKFTGIAIFDNAESIPKRSRIPLMDAVEKTFPSVSANEIKDFLSAQAA